jgi:D-threo-aldose 1-dehydrogenase
MYRPASADLLGRVERMAQVCDRYGIPLAAAALQFSLRQPRIKSTVVGFSQPNHTPTEVRRMSREREEKRDATA